MYLALLLALTAYQKQDDAVIEERFQVDYVLLDVMAYKKRGGAAVTDLKAEDFEVTEDKQKVDITFFDILDYSDVAPATREKIEIELEREIPVATRKPLQQIVVAIDFESLPVRDLNKAFAQLEQFFDSLDNAVDYKLNLYALDRGSLTKGFTHQVDDARSALADYRESFHKYRSKAGIFDTDIPGTATSGSGGVRTSGYRGSGRGRRSNMSRIENDWTDFSDLESVMAECLNFGQGPTACQCLSDTLNDYMDQQRMRSERVIGELEILTYKFDDNADLKTMLVLSPGFVLYRLNAAMKMYDYFKNRAGCGDGRASSFLSGSLDLDANFNRVVHACIKNRVIFHTFDVFNGTKAQSRSMSAENRSPATGGLGQAYRDYNNQITEGLRQLADESGGTFRQVFRLEGALNKAIEENRHFYVLGYNSPSGKKGKFRKIKVKVKRKGVKVRHRKGYFGS